MKIEDVELMSDILDNGVKHNGTNFADALGIAKSALGALRAEAWHPIEKAEELGAKDGNDCLIRNRYGKNYLVSWDGEGWWSIHGYVEPTEEDQCEIKRINPPEGA